MWRRREGSGAFLKKSAQKTSFIGAPTVVRQ
jgi:hypothetical protein